MSNIKGLKDNLEKIYIENPTGILPTALWKTYEMYDDVKFVLECNQSEVDKLVIYDEDTLILYFDRNNKSIDINFNKFHLALVNEKYLDSTFSCEYFEKYFKLVHRLEYINEVNSSDKYEIKNVDFLTDIEEVGIFISRCYKDISVTTDTVKSWIQNDTFANDLWIWVKDKKTEENVALGIAEYDDIICEGALEWIQVLPNMQGKGLGSMIVNELLIRLKKNAYFVTVSGKIEDKDKAEKLYRKCGFEGNDIWMVSR
jgi:GNAT superfamily N-acetyltransferase